MPRAQCSTFNTREKVKEMGRKGGEKMENERRGERKERERKVKKGKAV